MTLSHRNLRLLAALPLLSVAACATESANNGDTTGSDLSSIKTYFADAKKLDLSDLERVTAGFATDGLNSALSTGDSGGTHLGVKFEAPSVYAATAQPSVILPTNDQVQGLDKIVGGLSAQFGETELGTEVNKVRLNHLNAGGDTYFVESGFTTDVGIGPEWQFPSNGFGAGGVSVVLGLQADAALTSRVIVATKDDGLNALVSAPLQAVQGMRGFVYPRTIADVRSMKPGEMFALRGKGSLGANFGVGAPIFVADPTALSYSIVVSAGVSGVISGLVDVQLVRLDGDEIVVDVGVENGTGSSYHVGVADGFGIKGLCADGQPCLRDVSIAGRSVGLAGLVEKAVTKQLNKYLTSSVTLDGSKASSRLSLSRFRMHMDRGNAAENEKALQQLLKFDLRLAQALYNRNLDQANPAVVADFDAMRASTTTTRNFGFQLLGMHIYNNATSSTDGTFTLQTPDGQKSILFDSVQKSGGWFQNKHGYTRTGVAAQTVDPSNPTAVKSEANLFISTMNSDTHMNNDFGSDNIDALLLGIGGRAVVDTLNQYGDKLQQTLWARCPAIIDNTSGKGSTAGQKRWDEACDVKLLDDPSFTAIKDQGLAAIESKIGNLPEDYKTLVRTAANVRLSLQSSGIEDFDALGGAGFAFTTDVRLDDAALAILSTKGQADYLKALNNYLGSVNHDRMKYAQPADIDAVASKSAGAALTKMANIFTTDTQAYNAIVQAEKGLPTLLAGKKYVAAPMGIRFTIDADQNKMLESAIITSTAQDRAKQAEKLFDDLMAAADDVDADLNNEQMALYPLLALVPAGNVQVGMTVDAKVESNFFVDRSDFLKAGIKSVNATATGSSVATIGAGMFDLQAVINASAQ